MSVGLQRLREDADRIRKGAHDKGEDPAMVDAALSLDVRRREAQGEADALRNGRKSTSERIGDAIKGSRLGELWKYRVGDYRVIAHIEDGALKILVIKIGNRREVCR